MAQPTRSELARAREHTLELGPYWSLQPDELLRLLRIAVLYAAAVELNKARFYRRQKEPATLTQPPAQGATDSVTSVLLRE